MKAFVFLATGFEEIEAVATIDVLRRGEVEVVTVSITGTSVVEGAHGIPVKADELFDSVNFEDGAMLILPGGMPGASNLNEHEGLRNLIMKFYSQEKYLAAICAAPLVFGGLGILKGKTATCYPSFEPRLTGAILSGQTVVQDGKIITGKGPGFAVDFGLQIVSILKGTEKANEVAKGMLL